MRYEIKFASPKSKYEDYRMELQIWVDGKLVDSFWDGGEPEDNSFGRDWSWISSELEKAYNLGYEHGYQSAIENYNIYGDK